MTTFDAPEEKDLSKAMWEKEKTLVSSIFSFSEKKMFSTFWNTKIKHSICGLKMLSIQHVV